MIEYLDDRIKTPQDLYSIVDLAVLGSIARIATHEKKGWGKRKARLTAEETLVSSIQPRHPITEAYRGIRTNSTIFERGHQPDFAVGDERNTR